MNKIISLRDYAGIELFLVKNTAEIVFGEGIKLINPDIRRIKDAKDYYINTQDSIDDNPLYYMYRGVSLIEDEEKLNKANLRYDITVLLSGTVGEEYIKTIGHIHPVSPKSSNGNTFTEVYSVLYGHAVYIFQKFPIKSLGDSEYTFNQKIEDLVIVEASVGDCLFIPPHYGHVTVNIGPEPLVMANVLYSDFKSIYEPYKILKGAAAYILKDNEKPYKIEKNKNYNYSFDHKLCDIKNLDKFILNYDKPLYSKLIEDIDSFEFLYL